MTNMDNSNTYVELCVGPYLITSGISSILIHVNLRPLIYFQPTLRPHQISSQIQFFMY